MNWVYLHICPNGKIYVGITSQKKPEMRWNNGNGYRKNRHFFAAIKKYGWENIKHIVYEVGTVEEMFYLEKYLITYYNTTNSKNGYNHSIGGECGATGIHQSDDIKKRRSDAMTGCKNPFYGKHHTEETKDKLRVPKSEEHKKKLSEANKGKHLSIETRRKISESEKGRKHSCETRLKISKSHEGICPVKLKWITPDGEVRYMDKTNVTKWHPDWTRIE